MFAFALWDRRDRELWLCRDRLGKKPLYYGYVRGALVFGSELKALREFPGFSSDIDREALTLYLRHNYVPAPRSIYSGVRKVEPGHHLRFRLDDRQRLNETDEVYWSATDVAQRGAKDRLPVNSIEVENQLDSLLRDAVAIRMISDVPLGVFLSGGIDSSLVTALMQAQSTGPVLTFTIGFEEKGYNEADFAREIASRLGTSHTEVYLSSRDALDVIPRLPELYDEPFADSSQIPTFLVSQMARRHVSVALAGDGGDELFCGYNRYLWWRQIWGSVGRMPVPMRRALAAGLTTVPARAWNRLLSPLSGLLPSAFRYGSPGEKLHKLAEVLTTRNPDALYRRLVSHWIDPASIVIKGGEPETILSGSSGITDLDSFTERMMLLDTLTYLPDDILVKVDRASMGVSLETRAPLLDHRVYEFAARLPLQSKLRGSRGKVILRSILGRYVPQQLFERPKTGFGVPIDAWLRGALRPWAEDLLSVSRLKSDGFLRPEPIRELWHGYLSGRKSGHYLLWDVLMFQAWLSHVRQSGT
ncbi:MAG: Asparagine synthetase [glutamine-hydrolyzing] 1 [Nitrospira sp.]|nr:Asparagine synthetase [glutamine-hydrolyzing] 1 [Nitrospira sp.]